MNDRIRVTVEVNGTSRVLTVEPRTILADALRDEFGLRSIHLGCEHGSCGGCTVLVDGRPAVSCLLLAAQLDGRRVETLEGLTARRDVRQLQDAFHEHFALQCGYCTPGMLVTLHSFLTASPDASEEAVRERLTGNLCRCTGYQSIVDAALAAAGRVRAEGDDS